MKKIDHIELGATLFVPASHKDLEVIISKKKYPHLMSVLIDTEDGIDKGDLGKSMKAIGSMLEGFESSECFVFIRPKDTQTLRDMLKFKNIEKIDGFILPKFSLFNADEYFDILKDTTHHIMPSIEGEELFVHSKLIELREKISAYKDRVVLIRFGLEDMLRQLRMRRSCDESIFDMAAPSAVIGNFIALFKSAGFAVSGGVYPCFKDSEGFKKDVRRDLKEGLFSKTIIHPNQIKITNELYRVTQKEFDEALEIQKSQKAVFAQNGKMAESVTMNPWALEIIKRGEVYGVC